MCEICLNELGAGSEIWDREMGKRRALRDRERGLCFSWKDLPRGFGVTGGGIKVYITSKRVSGLTFGTFAGFSNDPLRKERGLVVVTKDQPESPCLHRLLARTRGVNWRFTYPAIENMEEGLVYLILEAGGRDLEHPDRFACCFIRQGEPIWRVGRRVGGVR
jgi:hypothetical protein